MGSVDSRGIPKYHCDVYDDGIDQPTGQEQEKKRFVLAQDATTLVQHLMSDINIKAAPQSSEGASKGITYMLKLEDVYQSATYVWCKKLPRGWEGLQELVELMIKYSGIVH